MNRTTRTTLVHYGAAAIFTALAVLLRWKPNSAWLVLAGAVAGLLAHVVAPAAL